MHNADRESSPPMGQLLLVDEAENMIEQAFHYEQAFHADDSTRLARFLSRWARELLKMSAAREARMPLFGSDGDSYVPRLVGPLWARILIPDESGNRAEWRFETSPENVAELADWLVAVGKWTRRPSTGKEAPAGLVGPDSGPEPEVFVISTPVQY